jgi:hypothetical protein
VSALRTDEGALRASFQAEYSGLRLLPHGNGRTDPARTPEEVADLVVNLPPGCALWRVMGGNLALTYEAQLLREVEFRLNVLDWRLLGSKGRAPTRLDLPPAKGEVVEQNGRDDAKAEAHARREAARAARGQN